MHDFFVSGIYYDLYGNLLNKNQKIVYEYHIVDDLSFNEIGEELGMTRQACFDLFNRADKKLKEYDKKLGLLKKYEEIENYTNLIKKEAKNNKNILMLTNKILKTLKIGR